MLMTGEPQIKKKKAKGVRNDKQCSRSCEQADYCVMWRFSKKKKMCFIYKLTSKPGNE